MINKSEDRRKNLQIVDLEGLVPQDHLVRKIDTVVDFTHIYDLVEDNEKIVDLFVKLSRFSLC